MVDSDVSLVFIPREVIVVNKLEDIGRHEPTVHSLDSIIRVEAYDEEAEPIALDRISFASTINEEYYLDVVVNNGRAYRLDQPFMTSSLGAYSRAKVLEPYDPDLANLYFFSQIVAQGRLLERLTDVEPRIWVVRYGTHVTGLNLSQIAKIARELEARHHYTAEDPHATRYATPGFSIDGDPDLDFCKHDDVVVRHLVAYERTLRRRRLEE